jgi:hypothetical protein
VKKSFATLLLIFAFSSITFCQINGQQPLVRIEALPVPDSLPKETDRVAKRTTMSLKEIESEKPTSVAPQEDEPSGRFWVSGEYLLGKMRGSDLPPLITTSPANFLGIAVIGSPLSPSTAIAFGGGRLDQGRFSGARLIAGLWLNKGKTIGAEVSYFSLEKKTFRFQVSSTGLPGTLNISRPFISIVDDGVTPVQLFPAAFPVASIGVGGVIHIQGSTTGTFSSRLQGAEAGVVYRLSAVDCCRLILLAGFRHLDLNEALTVEDARDVSSSPSFQETFADQFNTRNQFYGGQAGLRSTLSRGRLSLELSGTVALGGNRETVNISGARTGSASFPPNSNFPQGILASIGNIGVHRRNQFTFIPEVKANLGFDLTRSIRPFMGYQFLYWDKVVMPGEQVDRVVNLARIGRGGSGIGPIRPAFSFRDTRFWAQGLTTGVRVRF